MSGRTAAEAVSAFGGQLQQAVACVSQAVISVRGPSGYQPASEPHVATLNRGAPVLLQGHAPLRLQATVRYTIVRGQGARPWNVKIVGYIYTVRDRDDAEILAYHWHPAGESRVTWPHLHIAGVHSGPVSLRTHLPTGRVWLPDVIHMAIEELGARAIRSAWRQVLDRTRQALEEDP